MRCADESGMRVSDLLTVDCAMFVSTRLAACLAAALAAGWLSSIQAGHAAGASSNQGSLTETRDAVVQHAHRTLEERALMRRARVILAMRLMGLHGEAPVSRVRAHGLTALVGFGRQTTTGGPMLLPLNDDAPQLDFGPMVLPPEAE